MANAVKVSYKQIDGMHFFVSEDKEATGLCVAADDFFAAYDEVSYQLSALFKHNKNEELQFLPAIPAEEFKKTVDSQIENIGEYGKFGLVATLMQPWMVHQHGHN